jgi:dynein light intermediate chain 1
MENLKKWTNFVYETFSSLILKFPFEKQQELRDNSIYNLNVVTDYIKLFEEPQYDEDGNFKKEVITQETLELKLQLPLKEGVLKTNFGIPLVFLVNKSDIVSQTGERKRFDEDSDFILKHIRSLALSYGATIIYVSTKQNINLNVLYEYILHRIYKFEFRHKPNTNDKDSYFIPAGYDSLTILKNCDHQNELSLLYEDRVPIAKSKNIINEEEIVCEDVNVFLKRYVDKGQKVTATKRNIEYTTEDNRQTVSLEDKASKFDIKEDMIRDNYASNGKVNFDIFKQSNKNPSMDLSSFAKNATTADKLVFKK